MLRDEIETLGKGHEIKDNEIYTLSSENMGLREKIELLENIIKNNREEYDKLVSTRVLDKMVQST